MVLSLHAGAEAGRVAQRHPQYLAARSGAEHVPCHGPKSQAVLCADRTYRRSRHSWSAARISAYPDLGPIIRTERSVPIAVVQGRPHNDCVKYIALTIHGNYVRCGPGAGILGPLQAVNANGTGLGNESIFERIEVANGVVLHPLSGGYLQVRPDDSVAVNPDGYDVWETFQEIEWPDDRFSLKTWRGKFVCAEGGGGGPVVANRVAAGEWEKFYYEVPPTGLLPPEPPPARVDPRIDQKRRLPTGERSTHIDETRRRFP